MKSNGALSWLSFEGRARITIKLDLYQPYRKQYLDPFPVPLLIKNQLGSIMKKIILYLYNYFNQIHWNRIFNFHNKKHLIILKKNSY